MRSFLLLVLLLSTIGDSGGASAQAAAPGKPVVSEVPDAASSGTVTGSVVCADTQRPARFARVVLVSRKAMLVRMQEPRRGEGPQPEETLIIDGTTGIDGRFQIEKVPPGDYYALAKIEGYLFPPNALDAELVVGKATSALDHLMQDVSLVHVVQGRTSEANVTLHRGGLIAGRLIYDDGSPAVGVRVTLTKNGRPGSMMGFSYMLLREPMSMMEPGTAITDDEGRFRFSGLMPGSYGVTAYLAVTRTSRMIGSRFSSRAVDSSEDVITVFYPSAFRGADAKTMKIQSDDRIVDADITINLGGLHVVRGRVRLPPSNATGMTTDVILLEDAGAGQQTEAVSMQRNAVLREDGSFELPFVPAGRYLLRVDSYPLSLSAQAGTSTNVSFVVEEKPLSVVVLDQDLDLGEVVSSVAEVDKSKSSEEDPPAADSAPKP